MLTKNQEKLVRSLSVRKNRRKLGLFVAEGMKLTRDFLKSGLKPHLIFLDEHSDEEFPLAYVERISTVEMGRLTFLDSPSPVLAVFEIPDARPEGFEESSMVLMLDRVQDPGNVGTLLRSALWYGVKHVALVTGTTDVWSPKVVQASMGALAHVNVWSQDEAEWLQWAQGTDRAIVVADMGGPSVRTLNWPPKILLVLGNEGQGVSEAFKKAASAIATLPSAGAEMESLNVATSGSTLLYEFAVSANGPCNGG
ncbi:MAG: hypothetical protein RL754_588 [Bacteroidota bacterium]